MSEIKCRQWLKKHKKFHYWGYGVGGSVFTGPVTDGTAVDIGSDEQYTGLKDRNGKEIYEGDILMSQGWWWGPGFVYLDVGSCGPCKGDSAMSWICAKDLDNPPKRASYNLWDGSEVEVIGNIHENPELLQDNWKELHPSKDFL